MAERQLIEGLLEPIRVLPEVRADLLDHREQTDSTIGRKYDARVDLHVASKSFILLIEVKRAVYPRDVRQVLWQFEDASRGRPKGQGKEPLSLLVAESISPGAKELLREERVLSLFWPFKDFVGFFEKHV